MESKYRWEPPNGAYGWIIVFGAQLINVFNQSLISVFGLIFGPFYNALRMSKKDITLVMNMTNLFLNLCGLLTTILIKTFSARKITIVGCLLISIGVMITSQTSSMMQILISYCLMVGMGLGFITNSVMVIVTSYFTTKRSQAVSFTLAGSGIGKMLMPQIVGFLLYFYDIRGVILIIGALSLHGVIGACLMQPVKWHMKKVIIDNETTPLIQPEKKEIKGHNEEVLADVKNSCWKRVIHKMDLSLLKDIKFLIINFVLASDNAVSVDFILIFPFFLEETVGLLKWQIALCLSMLAAFDLASRLSLHLITNRLQISNKTVYIVGLISAGVLKAILAEARSFKVILILIAIFGYLRATSVVNQIILLSDYCTKRYPEKFSSALGLNMIFKAIIVLAFGQIIGHMRDHSVGYETCFHIHNAFHASVLLIWGVQTTFFKSN